MCYPEISGKLRFKKFGKNNVSWSLLSLYTIGVSNIAGVLGALHGAWWCDLPGGVQGKHSKSSNYLKVFKALQYIANSGLIYTRRVTQKRQTTTRKDKMKDCQLEDEEINFVLLQT